MSFKNLQQRFQETVDKLYQGSQLKFDGGKPSTETNDDPLIVRRPGAGYWIRSEGRGLPIASAAQDVKRLTLFTESRRGILFLAKQQLLQTGNTFADTRLVNPAFVIGNAVPFLHIRRGLRPIRGEFGIFASRDTVYANIRKRGQLQIETYNKQLTRIVGQPVTIPRTTLSPFTIKSNVGEHFGYDETGWQISRPELSANLPEEFRRQWRIPGRIAEQQKIEFQQKTDNFFIDFTPDITAQPFIKYFTPGEGSITTRSATNARDVAAGATKLSYVKDPLNAAPAVSGNILSFYRDDLATVQPNPTGKNDAITVSFAMGGDAHVQFRAFITGLQQSASPQYKTYQYIGRIEKFISYSTVERQVSFKLGIIAFSKDELDIVWKRINYMTGLIYPYGYNKGILQPNIVRMTIGNIYKDQPCYITSLNTSFNELSESWDIDREVPISALLSVSANLIEKDAKTANKPFYGILEPQPTQDNASSDAAQSLYARAQFYAEGGETARAIRLYQQLVNTFPEFTDARDALRQLGQ
jgi:hypothetical protein